MSAWIIKGRPAINDLALMLAPGRKERWITRKPPRTWAAGDLAFMWKGAPALCVLGLAEIVSVRAPDANGDSWFTLRYTTGPLENPLRIEQLRADRVLGDASFLKAGAAGTVFALTPTQATRLMELVRGANRVGPPRSKSVSTPADRDRRRESGPPEMALSIRQPWAELIMRGIKTIEVRTLHTHKRARVHVYASLGRAHPDDEERARRDHGLDVDALPRGVLVGTVEIVDCRRVRPSDSAAAAFSIHRGDASFGWHLARPMRAKRLRTPARQPQPMFFRPF
jgi:ASCH domain